MAGSRRNMTNHSDEPDLATVIAQAVANAIPTIVAQVTSSLRGNNETRDARVTRNDDGMISGSSTKRRNVGESSGTKKVGRFDNNHASKREVFAAPEPARKRYLGSFPRCGRCSRHHASTSSCGVCFNCNKIGHFAKECRKPRVAPLDAVPLQTVHPQTNHPRSQRGNCFVCGSPDHYRNACPRWVEPQAQVVAPQNQLQLVVSTQNYSHQDRLVQPRGRALVENANEARDDPEAVTGTFLISDHYDAMLANFRTGYSLTSFT